MKTYNKRTWLNGPDSPSMGNVVAFDGETTWKEKACRNTFLAVSDCCVSARLHKTEDDTMNDFINKLKKLRDDIDSFITHLESTELNEKKTNDE